MGSAGRGRAPSGGWLAGRGLIGLVNPFPSAGLVDVAVKNLGLGFGSALGMSP
jgi:hypothetical protein